jgi:hypothetical protein
MTQIIHLLFCWSSFLSWTFLLIDLILIGFLSMHAYQDGEPCVPGRLFMFIIGKLINLSVSVETLDHFEVPFFGRLANSFVDDE